MSALARLPGASHSRLTCKVRLLPAPHLARGAIAAALRCLAICEASAQHWLLDGPTGRAVAARLQVVAVRRRAVRCYALEPYMVTKLQALERTFEELQEQTGRPEVQ